MRFRLRDLGYAKCQTPGLESHLPAAFIFFISLLPQKNLIYLAKTSCISGSHCPLTTQKAAKKNLVNCLMASELPRPFSFPAGTNSRQKLIFVSSLLLCLLFYYGFALFQTEPNVINMTSPGTS